MWGYLGQTKVFWIFCQITNEICGTLSLAVLGSTKILFAFKKYMSYWEPKCGSHSQFFLGEIAGGQLIDPQLRYMCFYL